jgi:hypothetical protein
MFYESENEVHGVWPDIRKQLLIGTLSFNE